MKDLRQQRQTRPGLTESIKSGLAVPILSDEAIFDLVLPGHPSLAQEYAEYAGYPLDDRENLPRIAKFYKLNRQKEALLDRRRLHPQRPARRLLRLRQELHLCPGRSGRRGRRLAGGSRGAVRHDRP